MSIYQHFLVAPFFIDSDPIVKSNTLILFFMDQSTKYSSNNRPGEYFLYLPSANVGNR